MRKILIGNRETENSQKREKCESKRRVAFTLLAKGMIIQQQHEPSPSKPVFLFDVMDTLIVDPFWVNSSSTS